MATATSFLALAVLMGSRKQSKAGIEHKSWVPLFFYGVVTSLAWIFQLDSLRSGEAVVVVPILTTQPLFVIIMSYFVFNRTEHLSSGVILGAIAIVSGAALLSF